MKTVCKKLLSLMLVALLLVSAVPFQASAEELIVPTTVDVRVSFETSDGSSVGSGTVALNVGGTYSAASLAEKIDVSLAGYEVMDNMGAVNDETEVTASGFTLPEGATSVTFWVKEVPVEDEDEEEEETPSTTTYTVKVGVFNDTTDTVIGTVGTVDLTEAKYKALSKASAAELLKGTKYEADAKKEDNVYSVFPQGTTITVYLKTVSTENGGTTTVPPVESNTDKVKITVDTGSGTYTKDAYVGMLYSSLKLAEPARNGQEFLGWKSETHGTITSSTAVTGADTVTALWSDPIKYNLTLDENRGAEETVNSSKQVTYGAPIGTLPTPTRDGYVFMGWKLNGKIITSETVWDLPGDGTAYAQWKLESDTEDEPMNGTHTADGKVYLEIYLNGKTGELAKRVNITDYAKDNKITQSEVEKVVKKYYSAKSGYTLKFEGLFDEETWWWYTRDPETDGAESILVNKDGDDYVYVMVKNVKITEADTTNPKTGDDSMIAVSMTVMVMAAAALVAIEQLRKRKMI